MKFTTLASSALLLAFSADAFTPASLVRSVVVFCFDGDGWVLGTDGTWIGGCEKIYPGRSTDGILEKGMKL